MTTTTNTIPLKGWHHIEFIVGNAKQAAYYYRKAFGFSQVAYSGLETGNTERASYVLKQGEITFVLSTPYQTEGAMVDHLVKHGDGVKDVAFEVEDVDASFELAIKRGATAVTNPTSVSDDKVTVRKAAIKSARAGGEHNFNVTFCLWCNVSVASSGPRRRR